MIKNKDPCSWPHKRMIVRSTLDCKVNFDLHGAIFFMILVFVLERHFGFYAGGILVYNSLIN